MGLFRRRSVRDITVIFDIGSSSVGGAVVEYDDKGFPTLLFSTRRAIEFKRDFDFDHFFASMVRTFETVTMDVFTSLAHAVEDVSGTINDSKKRVLGKRRIGDIYCVFGSPWYQARVLTFEETFDRPTLITEDSVIAIAKKAGDEFRATFDDPKSIGLLENSILDYTLNGYRVSHQKPMRARSVGVSVYASSISKETVSTVRKPIRRGLGSRPTKTFSFLMSFFSVMRDIHPHKSNFATVDMRGEVTEIGIVNDDALVHTATFPFGRHTLVRDVADALDTELFEAHSRLVLYFSGKVDEHEQERIKEILEGEKARFVSSLQTMLEEVDILPKTFFLLSDRETEEWFKEALEEGLALQGPGREVQILNEGFFERFSDASKLRYRDHFLTLEALFIRLIRRGEI